MSVATFATRAPVPAAAEACPQSGNVALEDIVVRLGSPASPRLILDRISLDIPAGQFVCVLGPSGCGKSTLLNALAGFVVPASGRVSVDGDVVTAPGADRGVVFQDPTLFPWKTVIENVSLGPLLAGRGAAEAERIGRTLLARVGLSARCDSFPKQLSGSMQQRVGIARALANGPRVLLMDEPFGALDPITRVEIRREFTRIRRELGTTVLLVTHDLSEAFALATRIGVLDDGELIIWDTPAVVAASRDPRVRKFLDTVTPLP
jgi:sulfonate transport system ATP-binding protein